MAEDKQSYRQIFKATSLFGGVQVFNIIIGIIRSKFVAVILGPQGMGIIGLLYSTINFISGITNFGLVTSSVKNISEANADQDQKKVSIVITVLRRLVWITGIFGAIITIIFSKLLSNITFGNYDYTFAFIYISISLLLNQLTNGQLALLQGLRKLKFLATANLAGSSVGLIIVIPLYFIWGIDAIVPGIIITSLISLGFSSYFSSKARIPSVKVSRKTTLIQGKEMITMGFMISLTGLMTTSTAYFLRIFISNVGGVDQVGLYNAGFTLISTYVGMIFTAMSSDYYPRLAAINRDIEKIRNLVTQQAVVALLILTPLVVLFIVFVPEIILLLYSSKFVLINMMVRIAIIGMIFRAASFSMGFILYAKGDSGLFIKTSLGFNTVFLINNILAYKFFGLTGLGVSYAVNFLIHFVALSLITRYRYDFKFMSEFSRVFILSISFSIIAFSLTIIKNRLIFYGIGIVVIIICSLYSFSELNKRIDIISSIKQLRKK